MKLGIVANEFFDEKIGRFGGFGWAARQVATFFNSRPDLGVEVVFLAAGIRCRSGVRQTRVHDTLLLFASRGRDYRRILLNHRFDMVLTIDYRPRYDEVLNILSRTPTIIWVRDPRPPQVREGLATLKIPGDEAACPQGVEAIDCTSLARVTDPQLGMERPVVFATPARTLARYVESTYKVSGAECFFLPNIVDIRPGTVKKSKKPCVAFVGRLDPIKRPWLFVELARRFPAVNFVMLGQPHFRGPGSWMPKGWPNNLRLLGHVDGKRKFEILSSAWIMVNTSIHEALPTSFLEALTCETPLLSCTNQEEAVSRFGIFTGRFDGDGMASLPSFVTGLQQMIENSSLRTELGRRGREWVESTHSGAKFLKAFDAICASIGLHKGSLASS